MRITFLGAARTVTGSCYLVETDHSVFLVDCGLFQGAGKLEAFNRTPFPLDMQDIDFVLLTHAHIDHSGRLPKLYTDGYRGKIYATRATVGLCGIMLPDSGHIQETELEWQNRKNRRAGKPPLKPIYTQEDAIACTRLFDDIPYNATFNPGPDVRAAFRDAGHILGSAILELWIDEGSSTRKVVFSGDLGNRDMPILRDPTIIDGADCLIIESTYGDRLHQRTGEKVERFVGAINETVGRGGNVVIPSFAVGRTQEIIYELFRQGDRYRGQRERFMETPVYIDSPLATSATRVFRENTDCYDEEARAYIENGANPLDFPNLHFTRSVDESKALNEDKTSKVIISASGMAEAGRIKHHLKHNLWRPESTVLFVGYQAVGTLGRSLVDGARKVTIFGEEIVVRARVEMIEGFSGHADRDGLLAWIEAMSHRPTQILLVHGEEAVMASFAETLRQKLNVKPERPKLGQTVRIGSVTPTRSVAKGDDQRHLDAWQEAQKTARLAATEASTDEPQDVPAGKPKDEPADASKYGTSDAPKDGLADEPKDDGAAAKPLPWQSEMPRRAIDPRVYQATWALDSIQAEWIDSLEKIKREVAGSSDPSALETLLAALPERIRDTAETLADHYPLPE